MSFQLLFMLLYASSLLGRRWLALSYARSLPQLPEEPLPQHTLTITQAILSGDPLLESRLQTNLGTFPDQYFIWLIDENDAEARRIAQEAQHPFLQVVFCPPCPDATNPKLWKLEIASRQVKTPYIAVIDDDTTLPASSAAALVEAAKIYTVATGLPCYQDSGDVASGLLAQFVNNNSVFTYLGTSRLLPPFTLNGMGYVMRTEELERIEHFKPILHELTDDLALATLVLKLGGSIHQSQAPLKVRTGVRSLSHYFRMMHRWYVFTLLLMKRQSIPAQMLIFVLHGLPPFCLWALLGAAFAESFKLRPVIPTNPLVIIVWIRAWVLSSLSWRFFGDACHYRFCLSLLSELIQPMHLIHALAVRTIRWRTRLYRVRDTHDFSAV